MEEGQRNGHEEASFGSILLVSHSNRKPIMTLLIFNEQIIIPAGM